LILDADAPYSTATLDGIPWIEPEALYAARFHQQTRNPAHLRELFISFMKGALEKWEDLTEDFSILQSESPLSATELERAFMRPTNDANEGALGSFRVWVRAAPRMTLLTYNSVKMYGQNGTRGFIRKLSTEEHQFLRSQAREVLSKGLEKARRLQIAEHEVMTAAAKKQKIQDRRRKIAEKLEALQKVDPILSIEDLRARKITVKQLQEQLEWFRVVAEDKSIPMKKDLKKKAQCLRAVEDCIIRYLTGITKVATDVSDEILLDSDGESEEEDEL
jgi:hypothetical protein